MGMNAVGIRDKHVREGQRLWYERLASRASRNLRNAFSNMPAKPPQTSLKE